MFLGSLKCMCILKYGRMLAVIISKRLNFNLTKLDSLFYNPTLNSYLIWTI